MAIYLTKCQTLSILSDMSANSQFQLLYQRQRRRCAICEHAMPLAQSRLDPDPSGQPRGLLCRGCAALLELALYDPALLRRAGDYLAPPDQPIDQLPSVNLRSFLRGDYRKLSGPVQLTYRDTPIAQYIPLASSSRSGGPVFRPTHQDPAWLAGEQKSPARTQKKRR